jgi:methylenetetrahydrofolate reductase (NADPH)
MTFELVCEIEPPTKADLRPVRHQIGVLSRVASSFLIPDNHLGRATVSSIAVAHEVEAMGGRSIACLNSRDRNLLGLRRDLLTAAAYGVDQFLLVHGDDPDVGNRTSQLKVREMIAEVQGFRPDAPFRAGAVSALRPLVPWKEAADFLFVQISFSVDDLLRWRDTVSVDMPVYAGVMVVASERMAKRLRDDIRAFDIPDDLVTRVARDPKAGVEAACEQVLALRDSGAFAGVHLVPVSRYREVAARLEDEL